LLSFAFARGKEPFTAARFCSSPWHETVWRRPDDFIAPRTGLLSQHDADSSSFPVAPSALEGAVPDIGSKREDKPG
jgi:hypothetical protein